MPGYITHNIFGRKEFKKIDEGIIKESIRKHRNAFYIGLQGPDIFFYFSGYLLINKKNLGSMMHTSGSGEYMTKMLEYITDTSHNVKEFDNNARETCISYFVGFLGHYSLDRTCHPYIYWKTDRMHKKKDYHAKHVALETDIDYILCKEYYKKNISDFPYSGMSQLNKRELKALAEMLSKVLESTFHNIRFDYNMAYAVLWNFGCVIGKINDKTGRKEKIVSSIENKLMGHEHFTTLFIRDDYKIKNVDPLNKLKKEWYNPWDETYRANDSFYELMDKAGERYQELISIVGEVLQDNSSNRKNDFVEKLGNKSFLNDLPLD